MINSPPFAWTSTSSVWSVYWTQPDHIYTEVKGSVSAAAAATSAEALNLTVSTKAEGHMAAGTWRPLVCRHQRVKGEERLSSTALISSNDLLSKSQLLLRHDQKGTDHRGLLELRCSSLQPLDPVQRWAAGCRRQVHNLPTNSTSLDEAADCWRLRVRRFFRFFQSARGTFYMNGWKFN